MKYPKLFQLESTSTKPVIIQSIEVLHRDGQYFVRTTSNDGTVGIAATTDRMRYLHLIFSDLVAPLFLGRDARELESLVDEVYVHRSNYKLTGLALWCCVAWLEFSIFDLLGKIAKKPVADLIGGMRKKSISIYLSSMERQTTPEQEVQKFQKRLADTGAKAIKVKVGGRMSNNADAAPGRSESLLALARKTLGDKLVIKADANGSYDSKKAIEVGHILEEFNVFFFEEPCPFEEYEEIKRVADALSVPVAGGEQDSSLPRFDYMIRHRVVDIIQPDLAYNGGLIRTARVARMAETAGMKVTPHSASQGMNPVYMFHFVSAIPNAGPYHEFNVALENSEPWFSPPLQVKDGMVDVPTGPGLGITVDPEFLRKAETICKQVKE